MGRSNRRRQAMAQAAKPTEIDPTSAHRDFERYVNDGNMESLLALYERGAALVQRDGTVLAGCDAIAGMLRQLLAMKAQIKIEPRETIRSADIAVLISDWQMTAQAPDGTQVTDTGHTYDIVRRQE